MDNTADLTIWTKYGGTKFVLCLGVIIWAMVLISLGIKPDPVLLDLIKWVFGVFVIGNVGVVGVQTYAAKVASAATTPPETKP
jgi:hypothetical protein